MTSSRLRTWFVASVLGAAAWTASCAAQRPDPAPAAPDFLVLKLGGDTTARELRGRPFHQGARSLTNDELRRFGVGAVSFNRRITPAEGVGPTFNENSCLSCHLDGDRQVAKPADHPGPGLLLRLSVPGSTPTGAPAPDPVYGGQLQTSAVPGTAPEGQLDVTWKTITGRYPDGATYTLRAPTFTVSHTAAGPLSAATMTSARVAPPIVGLGLLEAITADDLRAAADPDDANHDGISGRLNVVWDVLAGRTTIGRFGWKAGQPSVRQQSGGALHDDMGVTSGDFPDSCSGQGSLCIEPATPQLVELSASEMADQIFYNRTIAVPISKDASSPTVVRGAQRFVDVGCAACHTPTQRSGPDEVAGLADQTFHPYTDLLLHDMGPGLADGRPEFAASGSEWRTPPLWTISRHLEVYGFGSLLHDGRAVTAEEAILWHGGEADASKSRFMHLDKAARDDLLAFLATL